MKKFNLFSNFNRASFSLVAFSATCLMSQHAFAQSESIKILLIAPTTGPSSSMGISLRDSVKLATAEINKSGGVLGRQIELIERDDQAKPDVALRIAQELSTQKIVAVLGFANSGVAMAANPTFQNSKIPVLVTTATATIITHAFENQSENYIFRMAPHDSLQTSMIVQDAVIKRGLKNPVIISDSSGYGQGRRVDLELSLALKGITPVNTGVFKVGATDMTAQLQKYLGPWPDCAGEGIHHCGGGESR